MIGPCNLTLYIHTDTQLDSNQKPRQKTTPNSNCVSFILHSSKTSSILEPIKSDILDVSTKTFET